MFHLIVILASKSNRLNLKVVLFFCFGWITPDVRCAKENIISQGHFYQRWFLIGNEVFGHPDAIILGRHS